MGLLIDARRQSGMVQEDRLVDCARTRNNSTGELVRALAGISPRERARARDARTRWAWSQEERRTMDDED